MRKFYRTTFTIDVLSEEPLGDVLSLEQIAYAIDEGPCVGGNMQATQTEITAKEAAAGLIALGSEPGFFGLMDSGDESSTAIAVTMDGDYMSSDAYEVRRRGHGTEIIRLADGADVLLQGDEGEAFHPDTDDAAEFDAACAKFFEGR